MDQAADRHPLGDYGAGPGNGAGGAGGSGAQRADGRSQRIVSEQCASVLHSPQR
jgi:hypothetical protein